MAISRMQQPRQLYGLGSFVKKALRKVTKPFTKVAKKLVPKEIAGIMRAAAPFLPAGYREAAYLLGTAKQTGRISPIDLALTAAPTFMERFRYNPGQGVSFAKGAEGMNLGESVRTKVPGGEGIMDFLVGGKQDAKIGRLDADPFKGPLTGSDMRSPASAQISSPKTTMGIFGKGGDFDITQGSLLRKTDGSISPIKAGAAGIGLLSFIQNSKTPDEAGEALVAQTGNPGDYDRGYELFSQLTPELFAVPEKFRMANGGRIGFSDGTPKSTPSRGVPQGLGSILDIEDLDSFVLIETDDGYTVMPRNEEKVIILDAKDLLNFDELFIDSNRGKGSKDRQIERAGGGIMRTNYAKGSDDELPEDDTKPINPFQPKPIGPVLPDKSMMASSDSYKNYVRAAIELGLKPIRIDEFESLTPIMDINEILKITDDLNKRISKKEGGRTNLALGTRPTTEESGLGGLPIEADMRYTGGFMPYGAVEKADDVPARLSKNEFVFTADAVRAAGGGSVNEGAKKMYATMKQLEKKPEAKGMTA